MLWYFGCDLVFPQLRLDSILLNLLNYYCELHLHYVHIQGIFHVHNIINNNIQYPVYIFYI